MSWHHSEVNFHHGNIFELHSPVEQPVYYAQIAADIDSTGNALGQSSEFPCRSKDWFCSKYLFPNEPYVGLFSSRLLEGQASHRQG